MRATSACDVPVTTLLRAPLCRGGSVKAKRGKRSCREVLLQDHHVNTTVETPWFVIYRERMLGEVAVPDHVDEGVAHLSVVCSVRK